MNKYLKHYFVAVEQPDVSAFEHWEMLLVRDKLADEESSLTVEQKAQLKVADQRLLEQVVLFHTELARITDFKSERQRRQPNAKKWWWYLDVLASLPTPPPQNHQTA